MPACYQCGADIPRGGGYRRVVWTGQTRGTSFGRSARRYSSNHYGPRTVCGGCAKQIDEDEAFKNKVIGFVVVVVLIVGGVSWLVDRLR
jgi:hypothetical protein